MGLRSDYILAFCVLKLLVVVFLHAWSTDAGMEGLSPLVIGGDDGVLYVQISDYVARTGNLPWAPSVWPLLVGWVQHHTGLPGMLLYKGLLYVASVMMLVLGVRLLALVSMDVTGRPPSPRSQLVVLGLLTFFPSVVFFGSFSIYRDLIIYALYLACAYYGYHTFVRQRPKLLGLGLSLAALFAFRWYAALAFAAGVGAWLGLIGYRRSRRKGAILLAGGALAALTLVLLVRMDFFANVEGYAQSRALYEGAGGGSGLGISFRNSEVWLWPALYLYSLVSNVAGPLPVQVTGASTLMGLVLEVPIVVYALVRVARGHVRRTPGGRYLLLLALAWFALTAVYNDNIGTALRLRIVGMQLVFVLLACEVWLTQLARAASLQRRQATLLRRGQLQPSW